MRTHQETFDDFIGGRLPAGAWTHEAHLIACWMTLRERTPTEALPFLRQSIQTHNCGVGTPNTDDSGYHETLSIYYITAVDAEQAKTPEELFDTRSCSRTAPLNHWSKELLFSVRARRGWATPDTSPLPIDVTNVVAVALPYP